MARSNTNYMLLIIIVYRGGINIVRIECDRLLIKLIGFEIMMQEINFKLILLDSFGLLRHRVQYKKRSTNVR